ncbi:MAG: hypothetical protein H6705_05930 [Myxococcales bacterium]|nr:hypothetical protein [Myxococcales bacterium]
MGFVGVGVGGHGEVDDDLRDADDGDEADEGPGGHEGAGGGEEEHDGGGDGAGVDAVLVFGFGDAAFGDGVDDGDAGEDEREGAAEEPAVLAGAGEVGVHQRGFLMATPAAVMPSARGRWV